MNALIALESLLGYFLIGGLVGGLVNRRFNDDEMGMAAIIFWPLIGAIALVLTLYDLASGRRR